MKQFIHVVNLEKYHPGYTDRELLWAKIYFRMLNSEPLFELIGEIDKWRFVHFILLELQTQKPIPLDEEYLRRKGFDLGARPILATTQVLHGFIEVVTEEKANLCIEKSNIKREEVSIEKNNSGLAAPLDMVQKFVSIWNEFCSKLPKVETVSKSRKAKIAARLKELPLEKWKIIFQRINTTPFLCGDNDRGWRADFDWIVSNDSNGVKVLEGKYNRSFLDPKKRARQIMEGK